MKIAVLFHEHNSGSGAIQSMLTLVEKWQEKGVEIIALIPGRGNLEDKLSGMGIKVWYNYPVIPRYYLGRIKIRQYGVRFMGILSIIIYYFFYAKIIGKRLKNEGVDFLYANTTSSIQGALIKKRTGIPMIWHIREFGRIDQNCAPVIGNKLFYKMLSLSDFVVFISNSIKSAYKPFLPSVRSIVVYNDISNKLDNFQIRSFEGSQLVLLSCGALISGKGHGDAIRALSLVREKGYNAVLYIAGKGEMYDTYKKLIIELNLEDYVHLLGHVENMSLLRKKCDIGIVASKMEAFGRVTIEGMLSNMVMIGANTGGTSELIDDHRTGLLYEVGNINKLADCIIEIFENRQLALSLSNEGYIFAHQFTKGNCAESIYNEMCKLLHTYNQGVRFY